MSNRNRNRTYEAPVALNIEHGSGHHSEVAPAEDLLEAFMWRVEKRRGKDGPEWRSVTVQLMPDGTTQEKSSQWVSRDRFYADVALARTPFNNFVFAGVGRPVI